MFEFKLLEDDKANTSLALSNPNVKDLSRLLKLIVTSEGISNSEFSNFNIGFLSVYLPPIRVHTGDVELKVAFIGPFVDVNPDSDVVNPEPDTLNFSSAINPFSISLTIKSKFSFLLVTSVVTVSNIIPFLLKCLLVCTVNPILLPIPVFGISVVLCFMSKISLVLSLLFVNDDN